MAFEKKHEYEEEAQLDSLSVTKNDSLWRA